MTDAEPAVTETERLRLEPIAARHVDDMLRMLSDPRVAETMGGIRDHAFVEARTAAQSQHWVDHGFGSWAAYRRDDGAFVGRGGIQPTTLEGVDVVEVGWCLVPEQWGNGFATEMGRAGLDLGFTEFGLDEIVAFTLPQNTPSQAVMGRLGMTYVRDAMHWGLHHVVYSVRRES
jgi:RimJ/RimL family protein N-acetyltransferase